MTDSVLLTIDGDVENPLQMTLADFKNLDGAFQIEDVSRIDPKRQGRAVTLTGLLKRVRPKSNARYLGMHSSIDNFHASIPLEPVRERGLFIYAVDDQPLDARQGGPIRFYIPDFAACHMNEIDECANVKFVDHVELTADKGFDNRPQDDQEHEALHRDSPE